MTEKELRKLNRYQLLELLIIQTERADSLQKKLEEAQEQLNQREIQMTVIGSIAEASMQLSGIFEAAQQAADMYLEAAKHRIAEMEAEAAKRTGVQPPEPAWQTSEGSGFTDKMDTDAFLELFRKKE